ncbi:putative ATPase/DNA-binding CsgD family transcriptional regulator [Kibdelosporangium banguiense]|uniref:ATPase/DNA-binding CsgD family transcriptional regulator n=1 Tax=Kibdelosporangium banguiense TaxID=1365924 RepID=A0ABS4TGI4_9PSEU|nr:LuxR C-terminal-related transcriptional regulator [Kibdelosporangium banguiense]MBP2323534.1 putative ATPase/DNA-binding CsgD family transcriptional regulator [Kibdelosporangium banguiense]
MPEVRAGKAGNLPSEVSSFIGRRRELGEVKRLLADSRLVTLTGVGGTGKTRLALRVAADVRRAFADGVWFVDLAELHDLALHTQEVQDPDVLAFLVAAALGLRDQGGAPLRMLAEQLADWRLMLILDNCEHLLPACAILTEELLRACPRLRVLATSREPLTIAGETAYSVPPLPVPDLRRRPGLAQVSRCESVALFLARAEVVVPGFGLTAGNRRAVADLCRRLDGLPLAIELAAAWSRVLSPEQILDRLADRFSLLSRARRDVPQRQRTLRACVDWSFELCAKPERVLWARLSVFAGGFELDAVEGVCADDSLPDTDMLDLVTGLLEKSILIRADQGDGSARYRMLETISGYGQEKLIEDGEQSLLRQRHRDWHLQLVVRARGEWVSDRQAYWLARLGREHPNLRAAVEYCLAESGEAEDALRIVATLPLHYWWTRGLFGEGRRWLDRALAQATGASALHARALLVNSQLALAQGDADTGMRLLDQGEDLARRLDNGTEIGHAAYIRGLGALFANDLPRAIDILTRARTILSTQPEPDLDVQMNMLITLGVAAGLAGEREWADVVQREMLAVAESRQGALYRALALWGGAVAAWVQGDLPHAAAQAVENLRIARALTQENPYNLALGLETLAWITAGRQHYRRAATLLGATDRFFADSGTSIASMEQFTGHHNACERQARDALGDAAFTEAFRHGQALTREDILAYALEEEHRPAPSSSAAATPLTRREQQVAGLIAQGLSNKNIATALVIAQRTAEGHVERILTKLGFTSRAQVAAWVVEHQGAAQEPH